MIETKRPFMPTTEPSETQSEWLTAVEAEQLADAEAQRAVQKAINARVRVLMVEANQLAEAGNNSAANATRAKARFVGRTSAFQIVRSATDTSLWRRLFGLR